MSLIDKMMKAGTVKSTTLDKSKLFNDKDFIKTDLPVLNIAFGGSLNAGICAGLTIYAGESKTFKTMLGLLSIKAYFNKYPDGIALLYDSEFGISQDYLKSFGIDPTRVVHIPIENVESLKFDIVQRLESIERGDKVIVLVDSLGNLASKKEVDDALDEKSVADMSRAKAIRSLLRIITPHLTTKDIPMMIINHVYREIGLFPKTVIPGGTAVEYSANQIFVITKSQSKEKNELVGYNFNINIHKSRFVREKSKLTFTVDFGKDFIKKYSGLLEIALESGHVTKPSNGWYQKQNEDKKYRLKDTFSEDFWKDIINDPTFDQFIKERYSLAANFDAIKEVYTDEGGTNEET